MDMGTQGAGRKRLPNRERLTAEDEALNQIAREAEARLAAKRAARAEAREIRMKELERQQKEEDSERYSRRPRRNTSASDEDERMSVGSRGSLRTNGYDGELYGSQPLNRRSGRTSSYSGDGRISTVSSSREEKLPSEPCGHLSSSSRASSRASSARASPVVEERPEKDFTEKGSRNLPGLSAATLASLGGTSSRRGSGDTSISIDTEASIREIKDSLAEVEEKYKKAMVSNAQLDNEKMNYMYQVDTLKDTLLDLEEQLAESRRLYEEKSKEFEREKHAHGLLRFQFSEVKAALQQREELLQEIRQLQQKQASSVREISDLQETIEWKDKKIGALERQKEFFDSIRSERDDLREEVVVLKEELKKHGIILHSEATTNGEAPDTLNNVAYQGPTKTTKEELNALKVTGDGTLGEATAVEVEDEIVENVGKREIGQNTEQEQQKEDPLPGDSAEDPRASEDSAPSLGTLAPNEDGGQSHMLESAPSLEHTEQVGAGEATGAPGARTGAALEQSKCLSDLDGDIPGPVTGQGSPNALDIQNQSEEAAEKQEQEEQDGQPRSGEVSADPRQESAPLQPSEPDRVSGTQGAGGAGPAGQGQLEGMEASSPPRYGDDTVSHDDRYAGDVPKGPDPSAGHGLEEELASQAVSEPRALPAQGTGAGGQSTEEEVEGQGFGKETAAQADVPASPSSPAPRAQEATGPDTVDARSEPLDGKEPSEDRNDRQEEGLDASQKKTKNKKKKNRKKRSPVEPRKEVQKELTFPTPDLSEVTQVTSADEKSGAETQNEVGNPKPNIVAGGSGHPGSSEDPGMESDGKLDREGGDVSAEAGRGAAAGEPVLLEGEAAGASGCRAGVEGIERGVLTGAAPSALPGKEDVPCGALLGDKRPREDGPAAPQAEGTEGCVMSQHPSQGARKVLDSISLEDDDTPPAGESGDLHSESKAEAEVRNEKDRSKEDCTLS
ncbi:leucine-rich repeat flightless-interacting protein 1 isoform X3 [Molossus molossus]|uniref:leucine-rich repeat flightless-interacting protein 1 isoform X3 n=1 Tax=Molossus molossus TaxID=27622 RepID=UPI0017466449|nr:leucine-rich repeat flightless-interacting protein 1 isoform X3 [Molossus molossus]